MEQQAPDPTLFLLQGLSAAEQEQYRTAIGEAPQSYRRGAVIYDRSRARRALAWVLDGHLRVLHGRVVMNDLHPGDVFGAAALFGAEDAYPSTVMAATDCRVQFIGQETVSAWMAADPRIGENYIRFLSDRIRFLNRRLATLTAGQTDDKLWRYLQAHRDSAGVVPLPDGMGGLAEHLGMGRSSLYRSLDTLLAAGVIRREKKQIVLLEAQENCMRTPQRKDGRSE